MNKKTDDTVLVIIPAYNEQKNIGDIVAKIKKTDTKIDVAVIDDGSADNTASHAELAGAKVIRHLVNMGYGAALQTGYKYAINREYDYLVQLDGDGQHDPGYIPELLKMVKTGEGDLVLGSRFLKKNAAGKGAWTLPQTGIARKWGIKIFAFLTSTIVGFKITDPTSGYQALNRKVVAFFTQDFFPSDFPDADIIVIAHRAGFKIKEFPMMMSRRSMGKSMHSGLKPVYYIFKMILSLFMTLLRKRALPNP
ncbi:MAG: glycosyltransferase family 2 protein [Desulfobacterales bacterium]|nr:glycosyltransferase family 2 protein [Desulfobacterales bacterium]